MQFFERSNCVSCGDNFESAKKTKAIFNPWLLELTRASSVENSIDYFICSNCGTGMVTVGYGNELLESLYSDYRGVEYVKVRNKWDANYSPRLNEALQSDIEWMKWRQSCVLDALYSCQVSLDSLKICVDIGGGEGGVIPDLPNLEKFVLETNSNLILRSDVKQIWSIEDINSLKPNLVMCCGLLEHLNDPNQFLSDLASRLEPKTLIYIEVPLGVPENGKVLIRNIFILRSLARNSKIWNCILRLDRIFTELTQWRLIPIRISEHINFFSNLGLRNIVQRLDLEVHLISEFETNRNLVDSKGISFSSGWQVLCSKK